MNDGIVQSMSRKVDCWDNVPMMSFFGSLKAELVHGARRPPRDAARRDLFACIEGWYNRQRPLSGFRYITSNRPSFEPLNPVSFLPGDGHLRSFDTIVRDIAGTVTAAGLPIGAHLKRGGDETSERVADDARRQAPLGSAHPPVRRGTTPSSPRTDWGGEA